MNVLYYIYYAGDIGGAMGLFIGASVLTIAEIIDLIVMQMTAIRCAIGSKKSSTA